jgi:hypothetical protein
MTAFRNVGYACFVLCLSASLSAQTINWQSSGGNTTTTDKVGVGTTAPASILELSAPAPIQTIRYTDPANYGCLYFYEAANPVGVLQYVGSTYQTTAYRNALMLINWTAGPDIFFTSGAERMRIDASGNVGVGTATPTHRLTVAGGHIALDNGQQLIGRDGGNSFYFQLIGNDSANRIHLGDTTNSVPNEIRFHTNGGSTPTVLINTSGNLGIGTTAPAHRLTVSGGHIALDNGQQLIGKDGSNAFYYRLIGNDSANRIILGDTTSSVPNEIRFHTNGGTTPTVLIKPDGNVGIGVLAPSQKLSVAGTIESTSGGIKFPDGSVQTTSYPFNNGNVSVANTSATGTATLAAIAGDGTTTSNIAYLRVATNETTPKDWRIGMTDGTGTFKIRDNAANTDRMTISGSSITFNGNVTGTTIQATYQDLAEWVPASETMLAGTVVVVGENADNTVTASTHAYDTSVAGVVSPNPGLLLGVASASKAKIATTGRVRVRVDATKSPIRKGDLLVTSDRAGMAMKSEPLDLGGVKIHRPGTLIGKALEPLESGEGEILVLLSLQ